MIGIGTITKLKALFTDQNLKYLETILSILTTPGTTLYSKFWGEFMETHPGNDNYESAWNGLSKLLDTVRTQLRGK